MSSLEPRPTLRVVASNTPTLEDVANLAGVSRSTASRVIRDQAHVNEELRERVRQAAVTLGYVPNDAARMLAARRAVVVARLLESDAV
jgi:DNA-binding LacI/PurR family transcriptional regulator